MTDSAEQELPWDAIRRTDGPIPWSELREFASRLADDPSLLDSLRGEYERAYERSDQEVYADLYVAAIVAMAAPKVGEDVKRRFGRFLLEKLLQTSDDWNHTRSEALTSACGAVGAAILPQVMDAIEDTPPETSKWMNLWSLLRLAADAEDGRLRQKALRRSRNVLQQVKDDELPISEAAGAAWVLADLNDTGSVPLMARLGDRAARRGGEGWDVLCAADSLGGMPHRYLPPTWKVPVYQWLPEVLIDARVAYRAGDDEETPSTLPAEMIPVQKKHPDVGRNDPCPCGSGMKYKKCCLRRDMEEYSRKLDAQRRRREERKRAEKELQPPSGFDSEDTSSARDE